MQSGTTLLFRLALRFGLRFLMSGSQKKQYKTRMRRLKNLQKGYEVVTIGGLQVNVDEVKIERKTVVLDVDGVYLTFELTAIKTVLPVSEGVTAGAVEGAGDSDSIIDGE